MTESESWRSAHYSYYSHRECEYFPCHEGADPENFNCLFCYCPLYTLGQECGGNWTLTPRGVKSCMNCSYPHDRENYGAISVKLAGRNP
ncbi:MAG: cysteine-rich small domain-containing protein [Oscillospiraceae bacterium]|jgi:Zn-finger protein|nr:cysteine-rich small domain-containing protein [Oscillospiraceae bacterium]